MNQEEMGLKGQLRELFVKNGAELKANHELAALITAASKMARPSEIASEDDVLEVLADLYQVRGKKEVTNLVGMGPQFVKSAIGYSTDFNDLARSIMAYQAQKEEYDTLYQTIKGMVPAKNNEKEM